MLPVTPKPEPVLPVTPEPEPVLPVTPEPVLPVSLHEMYPNLFNILPHGQRGRDEADILFCIHQRETEREKGRG